MRSLSFLIVFLLGTSLAFGQESKLANQYFQTGEYEKAAELYKKLFEKTGRNDYYFDRYVNCLISLEEFSTCEKAIKKEIKQRPKDVQLYVTFGNLYERMQQQDKADKQYELAIKKLPADKNRITRLGNAFVGLTKYPYAIKTYEKGGELMNDQLMFSYNLGDLYRRKGEPELMIKNYLNSIVHQPGRINSVKTLLQKNLSKEDYTELQSQLYTKIQDEPDAIVFAEMLEWVFIMDKKYDKALRQSKALDTRLNENGTRVYKLGTVAQNDKDYDTAIKAFNYIVDTKGPNSPFYMEAKKDALSNQRKKILGNFDYSQEDLLAIESEYEKFLLDVGENAQTALIMAELADFEARYLNNLNKAISILNKIVNFSGVNKYIKANAKLSLGDYYLMQDEIWEATLLYSQVDKDFREDHLGETARYKNAKLSYFAKDFEWSQAQFDILKGATSRLISNDAIDLSVFIMDNMGLDTTAVPLGMYAEAELLSFQNKFDEAFAKLDSISTVYPDHTLIDDILYRKANMYVELGELEQAIQMYDAIIENHVEEIRCDNAIIELAGLYENRLDQLDKAQALYEKLFLEFSNSTYAVEARKKYRVLRGDQVQ